jgi:FAD/FMN-containing dehydrogenase
MDDIKSPIPPDVLDGLEAIVGPTGVMRDPNDIDPLLHDERGTYVGASPMVVRPANTEEVAAVLKYCNDTGTPIVPQGGNTGLCGAATPRPTGEEILLSLTRMNKVRSVDPLNYTITVEAGVILADVQKAAAEADRLFPLSLGAEGTARIGGNLSTNAGGTGVLRYGNARELVLGLEVVLPDGRVFDGLSALRKDNTGYDLKQLFIGAEGTLGIITAAVLKLFPAPKDVQTAFCAVRDCRAVIDLLARARALSDDKVTACEWIRRYGVDFAVRHIEGNRDPLSEVHAEYLLLELTSGHEDGSLRETIEQILGDAMERGEVLDAVLAESRQQSRDFWRIRETIPEAQKYEGASIKHDISVPVSRVPDFIDAAEAALQKAVPGIRICAFGHVGDGNVHYNLSRPLDWEDKPFYAMQGEINRIVHDIAVSLRGSISAEHGIGILKRDELVHYKDPVAIELMRTVKAAIDPKGIMNPGKVV